MWPNLSVKLGNVDFLSLTEHDNEDLTREIEEVEVKEVMSHCRSIKSLGLDGFNFSFIKNNWDIIKKKMYQGY